MAILIILDKDIDKSNPNYGKVRFLPGQTLDIKPDNWTPGSAEKGNPRLRFVKVDGAPEAWAHLLEEPARDADGKLPARRVRSLDVEAMKLGGKATEKADAKLGAVTEIAAAEIAKLVAVDAVAEVAVDGN